MYFNNMSTMVRKRWCLATSLMILNACYLTTCITAETSPCLLECEKKWSICRDACDSVPDVQTECMAVCSEVTQTCEEDCGVEELTAEISLCVMTSDCGGKCGTQAVIEEFLKACQRNDLKECFRSCKRVCSLADATKKYIDTFLFSECTQICMDRLCPGGAASDPVTSATCPDSKDSMCYDLYDPVTCSANGFEGCVYSNDCLAEAAGFFEKDCVPQVQHDATELLAEPVAPVPDENQEVTCPKSDDTPCTKIYRPVSCSANGFVGCVYSNECFAAAAGFAKDDCVKQSDVCPGPNPKILCTMEYNPVICNGCRYSNPCLARAAGFSSGCTSADELSH